MIPKFNNIGNLPVGVHDASWQEFCERFGYSEHRRKQIDGLMKGLIILKNYACNVVYVDGSFVTDKERPNDYDACWEFNINMDVYLDAFYYYNPEFFAETSDEMKGKYLGEFHQASALLQKFQTDKRTGERKGIIRLKLTEFL
jgi:hypothetical protein